MSDPSLRLNEFLASNGNGLEDEDGDFSDWIEIQNPTDQPVQLGGWYLTDDSENLTRWTLPDRTLSPGDFLVVYASGKDRRPVAGPLHTDFRLDADGEFLALALARDKCQGLGFVSANKDSCDIIRLTPNAGYRVQWWHIDNGGWQNETVRKTDNSGRLNMPGVPGGRKRGWAYRIRRVDDNT